MNQIMNGLATFQTIKAGFFIFIVLIIFGISIFFLIETFKKNYLSTTICNIVSNKDSSFTQTVTYTVNNNNYTKIIPGNVTTINNRTSLNYAYPEGQCKLYYSKENPNIYNINFNPTIINIAIVGVVSIICILAVLWFLFLRSNREFAGVVGGIDVASTMLFRR